MVKKNWNGIKNVKAKMSNAANKLVAFGERQNGVPNTRISMKGINWSENLRQISSTRETAIPTSMAKAIAQLRDREDWPVERIADMFGVDVETAETAANLRANFGLVWHQAFHFLQPAGKPPFSGSVSVDVKVPERVADEAHDDKSTKHIADEKGRVGSVLLDITPDTFIGNGDNLTCSVRAQLRRKDSDLEEHPVHKDGSKSCMLMKGEEFCDTSIGLTVPGIVVEFSVEARSLNTATVESHLAHGQVPTPRDVLLQKGLAQTVEINLE